MSRDSLSLDKPLDGSSPVQYAPASILLDSLVCFARGRERAAIPVPSFAGVVGVGGDLQRVMGLARRWTQVTQAAHVVFEREDGSFDFVAQVDRDGSVERGNPAALGWKRGLVRYFIESGQLCSAVMDGSGD